MKDSIIDGIMEAKKKLLDKSIRANCVIVDNKYVHLKQFAVSMCGEPWIVPPAIGGLELFFDDLPKDMAFIVTRSENLPSTELDRLRTENKLLKEKMQKIMELIGTEDA